MQNIEKKTSLSKLQKSLELEAIKIKDPIHGFMTMSKAMKIIIDTKEFQRLRNLKQLGTTYMVFPSGSHSRFEHSLGTAHLADKLITRIDSVLRPANCEEYLKNIPELSEYFDIMYEGQVYVIDKYIKELIKIAALCHDIGHGPFSHLFDNFLSKQIEDNVASDTHFSHHEARSCALIEKIIKRDPILSQYISDDCIRFIQNLINPSDEHKGWIYEIVSNNLNGLDVDKYDYLKRDAHMVGIKNGFCFDSMINEVIVVDNEICYPQQSFNNICMTFRARHEMHKDVYAHKSVISAQYMVTELLENIDKIIDIHSIVNDLDQFCTFTDCFIMAAPDILSITSSNFDDEKKNALNRAREIINMLNEHKLYKHIDTVVSKEKIDDSTFSYLSKKYDLLMYHNKIGYVTGKKHNPLDNIYMYDTREYAETCENIHLTMTCKKIDKKDHNTLLPENFQEHIFMIFSKNIEPNVVKQIRSEYQILKSKTK
jgi:HD superfamily phosphohydrolase